MILDPDRIVFQRRIVVEIEMVMIMIGIAVMHMRKVLAENVIGEPVALPWLAVILGFFFSRHPTPSSLVFGISSPTGRTAMIRPQIALRSQPCDNERNASVKTHPRCNSSVD
jgi:hypothetical protein